MGGGKAFREILLYDDVIWDKLFCELLHGINNPNQ
jgi:hypothetical protein